MKTGKIRYHAAVLFSVCTLFSSCLDFEPKDQLGDGNMWTSAEQYTLFANQFYGWTRGFTGTMAEVHDDRRSDLLSSGTLNVYSNATNSIPSSDKSYTDTYDHIRQANILLSHAESYPHYNDIKVAVAEAKFIRAYLHFDLVQMYGDVIMVDKPLELTALELKKKRDNRLDVINFILKDLEEAAVDLPPFKNLASTEEGRASQEAAWAFISRVALYEGTWQKFRGDTSKAHDLLDKAVVAAKKVMDSGAFSLFKSAELGIYSYKYLFTLENAKSNPAGITKSGNTEFILSKCYDEEIRPIGTNISGGNLANESTRITRKFANMFLKQDGTPIDPDTWDYSTMVSEFSNRDNRMRNILLVPGEPYWGNDKGRSSWKNDAEDLALAKEKEFNPCKFSGYHNQKWSTERKVASSKEGYDYPIIRYAEVLLNYAEALYERDGKIENPELNESLNLVRQRVNPDMPPLSNELVKAHNMDMRTEIRRERTVELFHEGFRLDDLKRWNKAIEEMSKPLLGIKWENTEYQKKWPDAANARLDGCLVLENARTTWKEKHYLYPLPTDQLQLNPNLGQNPGW